MKAHNGVATLTRTAPEKVIHGLHEGADRGLTPGFLRLAMAARSTDTTISRTEMRARRP
jgi:hypothetical protein